MLIKAFHTSGEWDQPADRVTRNVQRMRSGGRTLGTRTEVTTHAHHEALKSDGWGIYHPRSPVTHGYIDCALEWDQTVWEKVDTELIVLNPDRLFTAKGFLLPPSTMPLAILRHRATGRHLVLGAFHMQLANTTRRRHAWHIEAATIRRTSIQLREQHPGWAQIYQGDGNRNQRITALRQAVASNILAGTKLRNAWDGHLPPSGGTHGPRSILDLTLTTLPGRSRLLSDDGSSDHRPYATNLEWA